MKNIAFILLTFQLFSCNSNLDNKVNKLIENKNKWILSATNRNYTYTQQYKCHCGVNNLEILIKVKNGKVVSASLRSGKKRKLKYIKTMQQHFESVLDNLKKEKDIELKVEYNKTYGHPSTISIKRKGVMDGNLTTLITNVRIQ